MYVNQIDNIIDQILDQLYLEGLSQDPAFQAIIQEHKIDFVEYREQINQFIQSFMAKIDTVPIQKLINNKENLNRIMDIIKRYVAYYYFLSLAFYYSGTQKDFRNNMIQYSKLQENSTFTIKNFFDTANNYQIVIFFKMIHDVVRILNMTPLQQKTLNISDVKDSINFLNSLGADYIDSYIRTANDTNDAVTIDVHNLIKTVVFREIYVNQEQGIVFEILNDIEESQHEFTFIDIIVEGDDTADFENFRQIFAGRDNADALAQSLFMLVNDSIKIPTTITIDERNNGLLGLGFLTPVVDDFLRYHRDTERLETESNKALQIPLTSTNNAKNVQLALLYQQRKKKDNTRAQLIVNKIDAISDYYSETVRDNPELLASVSKFFQNPLAYRKAVTHNYLDEVHVMNKIHNQGRKVIEENEYYLELVQIIRQAYFNFKEFKNYGTMLTLSNPRPLNMVRYDNIEMQTQLKHLELDMHTGVADEVVGLVGLCVGPFVRGPIQCNRKEQLVDIRTITVRYGRGSEPGISERQTTNGYLQMFRIIKYFLIDTIVVEFEPKFVITHKYGVLLDLNRDIMDKVIYWTYDPELDIYDTDTYENTKQYNFQETLRHVNSVLYDRIRDLLYKKLVQLIDTHRDRSLFEVETLMETYIALVHLDLSPEEKHDLIIMQYLHHMVLQPDQVLHIEADQLEPRPEFVLKNIIPPPVIHIDMSNPLAIHRFQKLELGSSITKAETKGDFEVSSMRDRCQHEVEWATLEKQRSRNLNKYNLELTEFIDKFAVETPQSDFVCSVCGQMLPIKEYVPDGKFNDATQRFVSNYVPLDIPLRDIREYKPYTRIIAFLDELINRFSLITGTTMFTGPDKDTHQKRKALIKHIIDLVVLHNSVNIKKNIPEDQRLAMMARRYNIDKDLDSIYFFELDNSVLELSADVSQSEADLNRLKYNNILLYFLLLFFCELNGTQIVMMSKDNIANIGTYLRWGPKLFGNLLIRTNINGNETAPILDYPVLCYLIFTCGYWLIKYKRWVVSGTDPKKFNPFFLKIIINSLVDLINSISVEAGLHPDDYVYMLTASKIYSQLGSVFKNDRIIGLLERSQQQYSREPAIASQVPVKESPIKTYPIANPIALTFKPNTFPSYKISSGIRIDTPDDLIFAVTPLITDITNCDDGTYYKWKSTVEAVIATSCNDLPTTEATGSINRLDVTYYHNMALVAERRCILGTLHDFEEKDGATVCSICGRMPSAVYTESELNKLADNLQALENERALEIMEHEQIKAEEDDNETAAIDQVTDTIIANYESATSKKPLGQFAVMVDKLLDALSMSVADDTNLDISKYPVYLRDDVYIIDHTFNGAPLNEPIILTQKDNRVLFKADHPHFKMDVYYYSDNRAQADVFYDAVTLKYLGYKEKHKDYVAINRPNIYLKISPSIRDRLITIGYLTRYINITDAFNSNLKTMTDINENYFHILDSLIREHIIKIRSIIDKFISVLYKVQNYKPNPPSTEGPTFILPATQALDLIVTKYANLIPHLKLGADDRAFADWHDVRTQLSYDPIDWIETNVRASENMYVNSDTINYYDAASSVMMYYLVDRLTAVLNEATETAPRVNIVQMYIEIIAHIYNLYNTDSFKNSIDLKRFVYIMNGSDVMVDLMRRGHGIAQSKEIEQNLNDEREDIMETLTSGESATDEIDDIREEAEALDVDINLYDDEDDHVTDQGEE
ncbi:Hypothetical protein MVR_LOCUS129 [uncultured virus]|nr:Hypothetical protein MVR_LOCUS129 [uncultured virus]